jgi:MFS family permease
LTGTTTFCSAWFTEKERPFALAVSNLGTAAGNLLGFLISGYFFHGVPPDDKAAMRSANWHMTFF